MHEQVMVTDALNSINANLKALGDIISQTEDQELRQTFIQMRNSAENCQHELYTLAKSKNYYQPAEKATQEEIMNVKNFVTQASQTMSSQSQGQGQASTMGMGASSMSSSTMGTSSMGGHSTSMRSF